MSAHQSPDPGVAQPMQALLALVQAEHQRRLDGVLGQAQARAAELRHQAHAAARQRLRQAFAEQRQHHQAALEAADAALATQRRLHGQQHTAVLLQRAWQRLPGALLARWQDPTARAAWVRQAWVQARQHLPQAVWRIVHPAGWPAAEQQALAEAVARHTGQVPQGQPDAALQAGLKFVAGGNIVDATLQGLLADRADIESRLLQELERTP